MPRCHCATDRDSEPRPQAIIDWLVWLALCSAVTVAVPFVLRYVAVGITVEVFFGIRL